MDHIPPMLQNHNPIVSIPDEAGYIIEARSNHKDPDDCLRGTDGVVFRSFI